MKGNERMAPTVATSLDPHHDHKIAPVPLSLWEQARDLWIVKKELETLDEKDLPDWLAKHNLPTDHPIERKKLIVEIAALFQAAHQHAVLAGNLVVPLQIPVYFAYALKVLVSSGDQAFERAGLNVENMQKKAHNAPERHGALYGVARPVGQTRVPTTAPSTGLPRAA